MKVSTLSAISMAWWIARSSASPAAVDFNKRADTEKKTPEKSDAKEALPDTLTIDTFDQFTSEHLTFVEFFSPYCSHCKDLAPKWAEAFHLTKEDQNSLDIHMRQVDCVKSGDLCEREGINAYPNLRVYKPVENAEGKTGKSSFVDSFPRALTRTPENFHKFLINMAAEYNTGGLNMPSASQELDIDFSMKMIAGELGDPYFVTMFSSKSEEWKNGKFGDSCMDCRETKLVWDKLSNLIVSSAKTGHINCLDHPTLCKKLGYSDLTSVDSFTAPRFSMFVPKASGLIRFDFEEEPTLEKLKQFATKLSHNSKYEEISARDLEDYDYLVTEIPTKPTDKKFPLSNRIALVFHYDKKKVSPEDKAIMPYLLEMVTKSPFNINLFASKSPKFEEMIDNQGHAILEYVNSDPSFENRNFNKQMHLATTLTATPTLYIFKENSLIPAIYQNFAIEDMRKPEKIQEFINIHQYPLYGELTPDLMKAYFTEKKSKNPRGSKVVVTFLDTSDDNIVKEALFNVSMVAHQYNVLKKEYYFTDLVEQRDAKNDRVKALKAKNVDSVTVIQEMRTEIPHLFDHNDVLFTYIDIKKYPNFAKDAGWDINNHGYKAGDSIIVSKSRDFYWDSSLSGGRLTNNPSELRPVLEYLLDKKLAGTKDVSKFKTRLADSPYHPSLRLVDTIHQHGIIGYLIFGLSAILVYCGARVLVRKRRASPSGLRRGLIGEEKSD